MKKILKDFWNSYKGIIKCVIAFLLFFTSSLIFDFLVFIFTIKSIARDEVKTSLNKNECKNHMSAKREYRLSYTSALMYIYIFNRQH